MATRPISYREASGVSGDASITSLFKRFEETVGKLPRMHDGRDRLVQPAQQGLKKGHPSPDQSTPDIMPTLIEHESPIIGTHKTSTEESHRGVGHASPPHEQTLGSDQLAQHFPSLGAPPIEDTCATIRSPSQSTISTTMSSIPPRMTSTVTLPASHRIQRSQQAKAGRVTKTTPKKCIANTKLQSMMEKGLWLIQDLVDADVDFNGSVVYKTNWKMTWFSPAFLRDHPQGPDILKQVETIIRQKYTDKVATVLQDLRSAAETQSAGFDAFWEVESIMDVAYDLVGTLKLLIKWKKTWLTQGDLKGPELRRQAATLVKEKFPSKMAKLFPNEMTHY